jgi:hypothetical protein
MDHPEKTAHTDSDEFLSDIGLELEMVRSHAQLIAGITDFHLGVVRSRTENAVRDLLDLDEKDG